MYNNAKLSLYKKSLLLGFKTTVDVLIKQVANPICTTQHNKSEHPGLLVAVVCEIKARIVFKRQITSWWCIAKYIVSVLDCNIC